VLICCGLPSRLTAADDAAPAATALRIGTYDPRAIAVAYARSKAFETMVAERRAQHDAAEARGDKKTAQAIAAELQWKQKQMHRQAFAAGPVDDILAVVKDRLADVAATAQVAAIVRRVDYAVEGVTLVDVTGELVKLFAPGAQTLKMIQDMKGKPPISDRELDEAEQKGSL
jgi:hypothetical protein